MTMAKMVKSNYCRCLLMQKHEKLFTAESLRRAKSSPGKDYPDMCYIGTIRSELDHKQDE